MLGKHLVFLKGLLWQLFLDLFSLHGVTRILGFLFDNGLWFRGYILLGFRRWVWLFASFLSFTGCVYFLGCYFAGFLFSYFTFNGSSGMSMSLTSTSSPNIVRN
jgi:hypothetical protein